MSVLTFSNGDKMPKLGLGTWKSNPGEVSQAVEHAITTGYRHIDCAHIYQNEKEVGKGLHSGMKKEGVARGDMWITGKLWNTEHQGERVIPALKNTLSDLGLDELDLYLIHWPVALKPGTIFPEKPSDFYSLDEVPLQETWEGMQEAVKAGLAKHIGVCNFGQNHLQLLSNAEMPVEMNQVELHPYLVQQDLVEYCREKNIHMTAYSPLGSPDRSAKIKKENEPVLMQDETVNEIAKKHNTSPALVLLAWSLSYDRAVIPKSVTPKNIEANLTATELKLSNEDIETLNSLNKNFRYVDGSFWTPEGSPYTLDTLWS